MMKNLIKKSLILVAILTTTLTLGKSIEKSVNVKFISAKKINLSFQNSDGNLIIYVKDKNDVTLYREPYSGEEFSKLYDFEALSNGSYYIEIEGQTTIKAMKFEVRSKDIVFEGDFENVCFKPVVRIKDNVIYISKLALAGEVLKIEFYDERMILLHEEDLKDDTTLVRMLDISKLLVGNYTLVLKSDKRVFLETVKKIQ